MCLSGVKEISKFLKHLMMKFCMYEVLVSSPLNESAVQSVTLMGLL